MTTQNDDTINSTGVPPEHPEAHQSADWGTPIHTYTRSQALSDGALVDVSEMATEAGFRVPVALTRAVWEDSVAWTEVDSRRQTLQDQVGRLWDVLWLASLAAKRGRGDRVTFELYRVPRDGKTAGPKQTHLQMHIGPGDAGEPVITVLLMGED